MVGAVLRVRYELTQLQSDGSLFRTFAAYDKLQNREVSVRLIKEPYSKSDEFLETLTELVRRLAGVRHPALDELYEVDRDEGAVFVVGQINKGANIAERLRKLAAFSVPAATEIGIALCEGLRALHRSGIAHGDVTSINVAMQADGETRLQNGGLWQAFYVLPEGREAMLLASAAYTAPEVSKGGLPTPQSDIYSLGVLIYEILTGRTPYSGDTALALALQHATEPVPSVKQVNPSVPVALDQMIKKAMSKLPSERYLDGEDLLSDLRMLQDAQRFGKSLTWPIKPQDSAKEVAPVLPDSPPAKKPVAAKEAAGLAARTQRKQVLADEAALPKWLTIVAVFVFGMVIAIAALFFMVNLKKPATVKVPDLTQMSFTNADKVLTKLGLHLVKLRTVFNDKVPADTVLSTDPATGALVYQGDDVKALVSAGSKFVDVPDLRGMSLDKARQVLSSAGLSLDNNTDSEPDKDLAEGLIVSQSQEPGGKYERGTEIHVAVSSGRRRSQESSNSESDGKYVYHYTITLSGITQPVHVRVDMTDSHGNKTVWDAQQNPGDVLPVITEGYGEQVTFRIFYNGELVKQQVVKSDQSDQSGDDQTDAGGDSGNSDQQP